MVDFISGTFYKRATFKAISQKHSIIWNYVRIFTKFNRLKHRKSFLQKFNQQCYLILTELKDEWFSLYGHLICVNLLLLSDFIIIRSFIPRHFSLHLQHPLSIKRVSLIFIETTIIIYHHHKACIPS